MQRDRAVTGLGEAGNGINERNPFVVVIGLTTVTAYHHAQLILSGGALNEKYYTPAGWWAVTSV